MLQDGKRGMPQNGRRPETWPHPEDLPDTGIPHRCMEPRTCPSSGLAESLPHVAAGKTHWKLMMEEPVLKFASALRAKGIAAVYCTFCRNHHPIEHATAAKHYNQLHYWLAERPHIQYSQARRQLWQTCLVGGVGGLRFNHLDGSIEVFKGHEVIEELPPDLHPLPPSPWQQTPPRHATPGPPGPPPLFRARESATSASMHSHVSEIDGDFIPAAGNRHTRPPPPPEPPLSDRSVNTVLPSSEESMGCLLRSELQFHTLDNQIMKLKNLATQELRAGRGVILSLDLFSTDRGGQPALLGQQQQLSLPPPPPRPPPPPPPPSTLLPPTPAPPWVVPREQQRQLELLQQPEIQEPSCTITEVEPHDAATASAHKYDKGDAVMAEWYGSWMPATISDVSPNNSFTVRWETQEITHDVTADCLRPR